MLQTNISGGQGMSFGEDGTETTQVTIPKEVSKSCFSFALCPFFFTILTGQNNIFLVVAVTFLFFIAFNSVHCPDLVFLPPFPILTLYHVLHLTSALHSYHSNCHKRSSSRSTNIAFDAKITIKNFNHHWMRDSVQYFADMYEKELPISFIVLHFLT